MFIGDILCNLTTKTDGANQIIQFETLKLWSQN